MKKIIPIIFTSVFLYSCGSSTEHKEQNTPEVAPKITKVSTITVQPQLFEHFFQVQGAVDAEKNVLVVPEVGGLIKSLNVKEGQNIQKGQVIATFDSDVVASNIEELKDQLDVAKYMYEKQKALFDKGVGTELALKQAEGQYKTLQQTLHTLQTQKGKFILKAPFSGYVEEVFPVVGQMAAPSTPIIRLIDLSKLSVKADISESYLIKLNKNSLATLVFPALENLTIENLPIKRVGKFINPMNRTVGIEVRIPNPSSYLVPNLMSVVKIRDYADSSALVVPSSVILRDVEQKPYLFVLKDGKAKQQYITIGQISGDKTEVVEGLVPNEQVIDKGCRGIKDGEEVTVMN